VVAEVIHIQDAAGQKNAAGHRHGRAGLDIKNNDPE
jgi:hypothetical protein